MHIVNAENLLSGKVRMEIAPKWILSKSQRKNPKRRAKPREESPAMLASKSILPLAVPSDVPSTCANGPPESHGNACVHLPLFDEGR
jgi:hypothetical protein